MSSDRAPRGPSLLFFDVNETLLDMSSLADRLVEVGAPAHLATSWFAGVLRDGFALTVAGIEESFAVIAGQSLHGALEGLTLDRSTDEAVRHVMDGFTEARPHPDVADGIRALSEADLRLVTLSNGSTSVADALLERAGVRDRFEALLSVEDAPLWKPAPAAYAYGLEQCAVEASASMLVAVHPWDIDGAARAGLGTAWIDRDQQPYPDYFRAPDLRVDSVTALATELAG